jgi:methyl coenzyme M reductase beta subunit
MNDNALIAAVLREVATAMYRANEVWPAGTGRYDQEVYRQISTRASELDPPEKNEKPNG